jgi:hypothetical protein
MEKSLDLKMPGVTELGREELKSVDGGFFEVEMTIIAVEVSLAWNAFWDGVSEGWSENKR